MYSVSDNRRERRSKKEDQTQEKTKEKNLVSNRMVELRGHVKAKIHPAVHRKK